MSDIKKKEEFGEDDIGEDEEADKDLEEHIFKQFGKGSSGIKN